MNALLQWIDQRTGLLAARREQKALPVGKPWWVAIWPSVILFTFFLEAVTGFFLWAYYSPSAQTAWESIYYVQSEVTGGWLLRGMHYYAGQVLLGAIGLYVLSMVFSGTYRAPRELVFWLAVGMAAMTIALLLTGDLLTWTQKGYWSTDVRTKFLYLLPWIGGELYRLAVGGPGMGHLTLTRFIALHAGLFTAILGGMLWLHARWSRRAAASETAMATSCESRVNLPLAKAIACAAVLGVVLVASCWGAMVGGADMARPGDSLGAELGSPRDPGDNYAAARPDWYFVGLYEFAHHFDGALKIVPIFVVPGLIVGLFLVMPFLARWKAGHVFNVAVTLILLGGIVVLTAISKQKDARDPAFQKSFASAEEDAVRVKQLIQGNEGIPSTGAVGLLWNDPKTTGPKLFKQYCGSCHDYDDGSGTGMLASDPTRAEPLRLRPRRGVQPLDRRFSRFEADDLRPRPTRRNSRQRTAPSTSAAARSSARAG